ncbi:GPR1/FUN34/yaaH family-domain-containing protein [Pisolithus microcarpus]|nr:GPR1/FUN34/yaaH family-domain-containing protein [Pisolithus microcarpus]
MSSGSGTEKVGTVDAYYIETVDVEAAASQPPQTVHRYERTFGNPTPVGMLSYATVILCSSLLTLHAGSVYTPNLVLLFATFYGGITQTLVGSMEMFLGSVFLTFGSFNFSYGALYLPSIGIAAAYSVDGVPTEEYYHALGLFLSVWSFVTFIFTIGALRTTLPIVGTLGCTVLALSCLAANAFTGIESLATAGGALGICCAFGTYYGGLSMLWTKQTTFRSSSFRPSCFLLPILEGSAG